MFRYPSVFETPRAYIAPVVKIELGARSDVEPHETPMVRPLLAEALPELLANSEFAVRAVSPRRTFLEKALLLHEETYRPAEKASKSRLSRHYYDLHRLIERGVGEEAVADPALLDQVVKHREAFFRYSWMDYTTMQRGQLRIAPLPDQEPEWRRDYAAMRGEMFFGDPPTFDAVLETVRRFEADINRI